MELTGMFPVEQGWKGRHQLKSGYMWGPQANSALGFPRTCPDGCFSFLPFTGVCPPSACLFISLPKVSQDGS